MTTTGSLPFTCYGYQWFVVPLTTGITIKMRSLNSRDVLVISSASVPSSTDRFGAVCYAGNELTFSAPAGEDIYMKASGDGAAYLEYNVYSGASSNASLQELTVEPSEVFAPGLSASAAGRQWVNDSAANITAPAVLTSANMIAAGFTDVTGSSEKWADLVTVADEPARLALTALSKPYLRVKQTDTDEIYMQLVQPPTATANWMLVSGSPTFTLQNLADTLTDGGDALIEH
jgi:hypothetical protein